MGAEALVRRLMAMPGVADARYDRDWLTRVGSGLGTIRAAGLALALLMAACRGGDGGDRRPPRAAAATG